MDIEKRSIFVFLIIIKTSLKMTESDIMETELGESGILIEHSTVYSASADLNYFERLMTIIDGNIPIFAQ